MNDPQKKFDQVCGEHFNKTGHSQLDMLPIILEEVTPKNDDFLRLKWEEVWIKIINQLNLTLTNILETFSMLFVNCSFF